MALLTPADTLPKLLAARAALHPEAVALREKEYGIWQRVTWRGYLDHVRRACMGFVALGLAPGDKVAILSENRREWLYAELAAMAAGAVGVGVYPTSPSNEVQYVLAHSGATIVVAEDQEQVDKILEVGDRLPAVRHIVVPETKGLRSYKDPRLLSWEELEERGERLSAERPGRFEELVAATRARRRGLPHLHLGHHRLPQGSHDLPPQRARAGPGRRRGHRDHRKPTRWSPTCRSATWPSRSSRSTCRSTWA